MRTHIVKTLVAIVCLLMAAGMGWAAGLGEPPADKFTQITAASTATDCTGAQQYERLTVQRKAEKRPLTLADYAGANQYVTYWTRKGVLKGVQIEQARAEYLEHLAMDRYHLPIPHPSKRPPEMLFDDYQDWTQPLTRVRHYVDVPVRPELTVVPFQAKRTELKLLSTDYSVTRRPAPRAVYVRQEQGGALTIGKSASREDILSVSAGLYREKTNVSREAKCKEPEPIPCKKPEPGHNTPEDGNGTP